MRDGSLIILLYHGVDSGEGFAGQAEPHRREYILRDRLFEDHMGYLRARGYRVRPLGECLDRPREAVALTFDDGERSCHQTIAPLLERLGFRGDFFIVSRLIGTPGYLTAGDLKGLAANGHGIHSHSATHRCLTGLDPEGLEEELAGSKADLEAITGTPVEFFSCPNGAFNSRVISAARRAGYDRVLTSVEGYNPSRGSPFLLKRFAMRAYTTTAGVAGICERRAATACKVAAKQIVTEACKAVLPFACYDRLRTRLLQACGKGWI